MARLDYGEYIFQQIITTDFVKKRLSQIFISITANIINMQLVSILCYLTSINGYIDFWTQILISIVMTLNINNIYVMVERYKVFFLLLTQYLIDNYSFDNYRSWKRMVILTVCTYACIALLFITVNNTLLYTYIFQYIISFFIVDQIEQNSIQKLYNRFFTKMPIVNQYSSSSNTFLITSYHPEKPTRAIIDPEFSGNLTRSTHKSPNSIVYKIKY